jgi:hypothetical protein
MVSVSAFKSIDEADLACAYQAFPWVGAVMEGLLSVEAVLKEVFEDLYLDLVVKALISVLLWISAEPRLGLLVLGPWKHV